MGPYTSMTDVPIRGENGHVKIRQVMLSQPRNSQGYQELEETMRDSPLQALEQAQACQHLDCRRSASRTVRE